MDIFGLNLEPEEGKKKETRFEKLDSWFDFMNVQFGKIEESHQKSKINNLLIDNDIDLIK